MLHKAMFAATFNAMIIEGKYWKRETRGRFTILQHVHFYITWFCAEIALQVAAIVENWLVNH